MRARTAATIRQLVVLAISGGGVALTFSCAQGCHGALADLRFSARQPSAFAAVPDAVVPVAVPAFQRREIELAFYADRARRDSLGAADRARLAALHLDRARETGNFKDVEQAERWARESLALREAHNSGTFALLASILMAQHRFPEALRAARRADALEPGVVGYRALVGEVLVELGDYDRARLVFDSLRREPLDDAASLRIARWYEISGRLAWAEGELRRVLGAWLEVPDAPASQIAWLRIRLADLAIKDRRLADADSQLQAALAVAPGDHRVLGALARLDARRGRWRRSITWGERAVAVSKDPITLGVLSDAWAALGDSARARAYETTMRDQVESEPNRPHRSYSLFLLDHNREVGHVLSHAREELRERKDVHGYDLYAWALHKAGRHREAWTAIQNALRLGTQDPLLERHAAEISRSVGATGG